MLRSTQLNSKSSRSHAVLQITILQRRIANDGGEISLTSKYCLVDLAGFFFTDIKNNLKMN